MSGVKKDREVLLGDPRHGEAESAQDGRADAELMRSHEHDAEHEHHEDPEAIADEPATSGADRYAGAKEQEGCADGNDDARLLPSR